MATENLFELATRKKFRFSSTKGALSVEDLWDLSEDDLDNVYKNLNRQQVKSAEESLLNEVKTNTDLDAAIEIVKYVFTTKRKEAEERKSRANKEALRHKYIDALARKEDAEIENMSKEELQAMIESL